MRHRTKRLLTAAILTLLAITIGASSAAAAARAKVHKITACGYTATAPGTYELTQNVMDSGSGTCITLNGSNMTLYLDSHTITGTATDGCVAVIGGADIGVKDAVIGGKMTKPGAKKKTKTAKPATLTNCENGIVVGLTSEAMVSNLNIVAPASTGVDTELAEGTKFSHINVPMHAANSGFGFVFEGGADNVVTDSSVNYDGAHAGFVVVEETGDTFLRDTVTDPYNSAGSTGTGFSDSDSARDTYSHCTSSGQFNGFDLAPTEYGPVTVTYDTAKGSPANASSIGFKITGAFQATDTTTPYHTLVSHNKTTGFVVGFEDVNGGIPGAPLAEKWTNNTAANYSGAGFAINDPADYVITGNIADANTSGKKYTGGTTYGFVLINASAVFPPATFANNQAYDNEYGFFSSSLGVGGKGNIAKRNKFNSHGVEITG